MMRFREHRGTLADSMKTVVEVRGAAGLFVHLAQLFPERIPAGIECQPYGGKDERIGWDDVHSVSIKGFGIVGFTDGPLISGT